MKPKNNTLNSESKANQRAQNSFKKMHEKEKIIQFLNIGDNSLQPKNEVHIDEPIFQPEPKVILFTDYEPLQLRSQILRLRNRDIVPRRVSIIHPETRLFQVTPYKKKKDKNNKEVEVESIDMTNTKVASGMEVAYLIKFTPEAKVDVRYDLIVITEREKFMIPIIGIGCKVMLEFNETLDFGEVPVKYKIEKPIILRNVGEKITKWKLKCPSVNITVSKKEGILEIGKSEQIICTFCPQDDREYEEDMLLIYDEFEAVIKIYGRSKNDQVSLNKKVLELDKAYITKHSQSFVTINNNTNVPIDFIWKRHESKEMEENAKKETFIRLNRQEDEEKILNELQYDYEEVQGDRSFDIDDSYDEEEILKINERHHLKNLTIISRRFQKIKKCLDEDQMVFEHDNFIIEPIQGKIWPNTGMNICITFKPIDAIAHKVNAFCDVTGLDYRMKLELKGIGIGPKAEVSYNEKNLLDIAIGSEINIADGNALVITNTGVIDCHFTIKPSQTPCGKQFKFGLMEYTLKPAGEDKNNGQKIIPIKFVAERLGEFSEKFIIQITRSNQQIPIVFKGHVIAPSCRFELGNKIGSNGGIEFGPVSLLQQKQEIVYLHNDSNVNIRFKLRISSDTEDSESILSIFEIKPLSGSIKGQSSIPITITFKPDVEKSYDIVVLMDMEDIGYDMLTLPISGECKIPEIKISFEKEESGLNFGEVYIGLREERIIKLTNSDNVLTSQYQIVNLEAENQNNQLGILAVDNEKGIILPGNKEEIVTVYLTTKKTGPISLKLDIKCKTRANASNKDGNNITTILVTADSLGPKIKPLSGLYKETFQNLKVLTECTEKLDLVNCSPIPAKVTVFTRNPNSIFKIPKGQFDIEKNSTYTMNIKCNPDTAGIISDILHFIVDHGEGFEIEITGKPTGFSVRHKTKETEAVVAYKKYLEEKKETVPKDPIIDFGIKFTKSEHHEIITFNNEGTKNNIIEITKSKDQIVEIEKYRAFVADRLKDTKFPELGDECFMFDTGSKSVTIPKKKKVHIKVIAKSNNPGYCSINYDIKSTVEGGQQNSKDTKLNDENYFVRCIFVNPSLDFSPRKLEFKYNYSKDNPISNLIQKLDIRNTCELTAEFSLSVPSPFSICDKKDRYEVKSKCSETVVVQYDPSEFRESKKAIKDVKNYMIIKHLNHDSEESLEMNLTLNFPNLKYIPNQKELKFGTILNDTTKTMSLDILNESEMDLYYEWLLLEDEAPVQEKKPKQRKIPLNEIFAIVPMSGVLGKDERETIRVTFTPGYSQKYSAKMKCVIQGGPEEVFTLIGESSTIDFKLFYGEQNLLDSSKKDIEILLGKIPFNKETRVELELKNTGNVDFNYSVSYVSKELRYIQLVSPHREELPKECPEDFEDKKKWNSLRKIKFDVMPGVPDFIIDFLEIQIAHFEPIIIQIKAVGIYSSLIVNLPRKPDKYNNINQYKNIDLDELVKTYITTLQERKEKYKLFIPKENKNNKNAKEISKQLKNNDKKDKNNTISKQEECEMEFNRQELTEKLKSKLNLYETQNTQRNNYRIGEANSIAIRKTQIEKIMSEMKIAEYFLHFGDMTVNDTKEKKFTVYNQNENYIHINLSLARTENFSLKPNYKEYVIPPFSSLDLELTHEAKYPKEFNKIKENKEVKNNLRIMVKEVTENGVSSQAKEFGEIFDVEFIFNVWQPDLEIRTYDMRESINLKELENKLSIKEDKEIIANRKIYPIDFGNVYIGRKKKMYFFLENTKKVSADWKLLYTDKDGKVFPLSERKEEDFIISPYKGVIQPLKKELVTVEFSPLKERRYEFSPIFEIKSGNNNIPLTLDIKGNAKEIIVKIENPELNMPTVLPHFNYSLQSFKVYNPNDMDVELISLDFDKQYIEENELINFYKDFNNGTPNPSIDLTIRKAGTGLWPKFLNYKIAYNKKIEEIRSKNTKLSKALIDYSQGKLLDLGLDDDKEIIYPYRLKEEKRENIIILGPEKCGKSTLAEKQKEIHKRGVVDFNRLLEWNKENNFNDLIDKCSKYLVDRKQELDIVKLEREKLQKKAKTDKKAKIELDELPPIIESDYEFLSKELVVELIKNRILDKDCSTGAVFDNLNSKIVKNLDIAVEIIEEALKNENLTIVNLKYPTEKDRLTGVEFDCCKWVDFQNIIEKKLEIKPLKVYEDKNKQKLKPGEKEKKGQSKPNNQGTSTRVDRVRNDKDQNKKLKSEPNVTINYLTPSPEERFNQQILTANEIVELFSKDLEFTTPKILTEEEKLNIESKKSKIISKILSTEEVRREEALRNRELLIKKAELERESLKLDEDISNNYDKINMDEDILHKSLEIPSIPEVKPVFRKEVIIEIPFYLNHLFKNYLEKVNAPLETPTEELPLPPPEEFQVVRPVNNKSELRNNKNSYFLLKSINYEHFNPDDKIDLETVIRKLQEEDERYQRKIEEFNNIMKDPKKKKQYEEDKKKKEKEKNYNPKKEEEEMKLKNILEEKSRWIIPARSSILIFVSFFCKEIFKQTQYLCFEVLNNPNKELKVVVNAETNYPTLIPLSITSKKAGIKNLLDKKKGQEDFDFGYMLILKEDKDVNKYSKYDATHKKVLKFKNNGLFDVEVKFVFLSSLNQENLGFNFPIGSMEELNQGGAKEKGGKKDASFIQTTPFALSEDKLTIKMGCEESLNIYAFPLKSQEYKDELICLIQDNPSPIQISLSCKGCEPRIEVEPDALEFEKLIVNQALTKTIKLRNVGEVGCSWAFSVANNGQIPPQFIFSSLSGVIEKKNDQIVTVKFNSPNQEKFSFNLCIDCEDNLGYKVKTPTKVIKITSEAFEVSVQPIIPFENNVLDFGKIKVREFKHINFSLKNHGIYKVKFKFEINPSKKLWTDLFKFEPTEGEIEANKEKQIMALCMPYSKDISISNKQTEIKLIIFEGETNSKYKEVPIFTNVSSFFSKYTINPLKNINFGSFQFNEQSTRSIEIRNEGQFEFVYDVSEYMDETMMKKIKEDKNLKELDEQKQKELEIKELIENFNNKDPKKVKKDVAPKKKEDDKKKKEELTLKISRFVISNYKGTVPPGSSAKLDITFLAEGHQFYQSVLNIDISSRSPDDNPLGIPFDLIGESCIPGIETKDFDAIFEEQTVMQNFEMNKHHIISSSIYSIEEKMFWFGTTIAGKKEEGDTEKFKIINPNKIACTVKINMIPRTNSKSEGFAFEVSHKTPFKIYPHESEYVSVTFKPTNVMPYSGIFEAIVEGGESYPETGVLRFEIRGEGTLPTLLLDSPNVFSEEGYPLLKIPKTRIQKKNNQAIVLKNDGVVPATVIFEPFHSQVFSLNNNSNYTIQPKSYMAFEVNYQPNQVGVDKITLFYKTLFNPYEQSRIIIQGEGYFEAISFENLDKEGEINFGDLCVNSNIVKTFEIQNHSDNPYRFNFLNIYEPFIEIYPSVGFLLGKSHKEIKIKFEVKESDIKDLKEPVKYHNKDMFCEVKQVKFSGQEIEWDNTYKMKKKITLSENAIFIKKQLDDQIKRKEELENLFNIIAGVKKGQEKKKDIKPKKEDELKINPNEEPSIEIEELLPEPVYTVVDKTEKYPFIKFFGVADYARYQCAVKEIRFKPTMMYQSRKHEFQLKNLSNIALHYNFTFTNPFYSGKDNSNIGNINNYSYSMSYSQLNLKYNPNNDPGPFTVIPKQGVIAPMSDESITVRFSPMEVDEMFFKRQLNCNINDLDPTKQQLVIDLSGDSERPICHFELSKGVKQENGITYLEIESIGMSVLNKYRFYVLNPTSLSYEFEWEPQDEDDANLKMIKCVSPKGVIYSGKKFEMIFEYTPNSLGIHETIWNFKVPSEKMSHKFTIVGNTREPIILFSVGKVNFENLLVDGRKREIIQIINEEHIPYKFYFDKDSIKGNNSYGDSLFLNPMMGTLKPKSSTSIEITFAPKVEKEFNYNLCLKIKGRQKPLLLNVKGIGYNIRHNIFLDNKPDLKLYNKQEHVIDFGEFFVKERRERSIIIENNGAFFLNYVFKKNRAEFLTISPETATVKKSEKLEIKLTILPLFKFNMTNHKIFLQIYSGPIYTFIINAKARTPMLSFSTTKVDFGAIYVQKPPQPITRIITVKNMDKEALTIETNYENKNKNYLDIQLSTGQVILPYTNKLDALEIPIIFTPREIFKYKEIINFKFNGIYDQEIEITGEGIPLKLEVEDNLQILNFGIIQLGQQKKLEFKLVNKGKQNIDVLVLPENKNNFYKRCLSFVNFDYNKIHKLEPKNSLLIDVLFNPNIRIPLFTEELLMKINNNDTRRLISISGASYGVDVKLVGDLQPFGTVVANSLTQRYIILKNFGDLHAKFKWETPLPNSKRDYTKFFTFTPMTGVIPPHEDIVISITFHPKVIESNIYFEKIKCNIDNFEPPLTLNLYGKSCDVPKEAITEKKLETEVRMPITYEIKLKNPTDKLWRISPTISTKVEQFMNYFKGEHTFEIKPGIEGTYIITYIPLTMSLMNTGEKVEHEATVFFPLPDGSAKVHKLIGVSGEPKAKKTIFETCKAREWKQITLIINNWLYSSQRFKVTRVHDKKDNCIFLKGANTIDIGGNSTKEYKLNYQSQKELNCVITVTFENVDTKEYMFYQINMTTTVADPYPPTILSGQVRDICINSIIITNPLKEDISIISNQIFCDNEYIIIKPNNFVIKGESEIQLELVYRPLVFGESKALINIKSNELGELKFPLILKGTQNPPPKQIQPVTTTLGSEKIFSFTFQSYLKKLSTYTLKIEKFNENMPNTSDFIPEQLTIQAQPSTDFIKGTEIIGKIKYEPYSIGENRCILKVTSPEGGEYAFVLKGVCNSPQAQGPYKVPIGKDYKFEFKNPLNEGAEIIVRFDNLNFTCGKLNNKIEAKKTIIIPIMFKNLGDGKTTGRMIITLNKLPPWIIYLQAE